MGTSNPVCHSFNWYAAEASEANMSKSEDADVPKFTSFRAKTQLVPAGGRDTRKHGSTEYQSECVDGEPQPREIRQDHGSQQRRRRIRTTDNLKGHKSLRGRRSHNTETSERRVSSLESQDQTSVHKDEGHQGFQVDKKGDPHNLIYGTIHRYSIPSYRRWGYGSVLGLPSQFKINRNIADGSLVVYDQHAHGQGKREKYSFARNERKGTKRLRVPKKGSLPLDETVTDFIPFKSVRGHSRRQQADQDFSSSSEENDQHYRSIEGKAKPRSDHEEELSESASESSVSRHETINLDFATASLRARGIELSNRLELEPTNIKAWLDLIEHQDDLLGNRESVGGHRVTDAEKRSTADIKVSMYEKALSKVDKADKGYEQLLVGLMDEGSKLWESKVQARKWQALLHDHPQSVGLWTKYLDFCSTNFRTFTFEALRRVYVECMDVLRGAMPNEEQIRSRKVEDSSKTPTILIYVILRFTLFMREAGFFENAVAIWQGLLELNFCKPEDVVLSHKLLNDTSFASFEEFWDSEVPRIGELGARGWNGYVANQRPNPTPPQNLKQQETTLKENGIFQSWLGLETYRAFHSRNPVRTTDELQTDDPYIVVFFSDIRDFLTYFPDSQSRNCLVIAFLDFCRLSPLRTTECDEETSFWFTDSLIRTEALEQSDAFLRAILGQEKSTHSRDEEMASSGSFEVTTTHPHSRPGPFALGLHNFAISTETLFAREDKWFKWLGSWKLAYGDGEEIIDLSWFRRVLKTLIPISTIGTFLAELYLAFEWTSSPESARKTAKSLLKEQPSNLRLYNAYALIEWRLGNAKAAINVFSTAVNMYESITEEHKEDLIILWRSWIWELLEEGDLQGAVNVILSIPEGKAPAFDPASPPRKVSDLTKICPTSLLKARRALESGLEASISITSAHSVAYADLLALVVYLSQKRNVNAALEEYQKTSTVLARRLPTGRITLELLHQAKAHLLYYHAVSSNCFRPALLREEFAGSIKLFPQNTIFLSLYAWNEARFRIDDRVRSMMSDVALRGGEDKDTVIGWVFSIWNECNGTLGWGHNTNSIKAVFERALGSHSGKSSPTIWKLYFLFSLHHLPRSHTTSIFYRAIRACPWAKPLYLLAFKHLTTDLPDTELRSIYEVMREKELRIHVELDDHDDDNTVDRMDTQPGQEGAGGGKRGAAGLPLDLPSDPEDDGLGMQE